jgi:hypothetical protein
VNSHAYGHTEGTLQQMRTQTVCPLNHARFAKLSSPAGVAAPASETPEVPRALSDDLLVGGAVLSPSAPPAAVVATDSLRIDGVCAPSPNTSDPPASLGRMVPLLLRAAASSSRRASTRARYSGTGSPLLTRNRL